MTNSEIGEDDAASHLPFGKRELPDERVPTLRVQGLANGQFGDEV